MEDNKTETENATGTETENVTGTETENEEQTDSNSVSALVEAVRSEYEHKISTLKEKHKNELAERDKIILQIIDGAPKQEQSNTILEKLNAKRNFKKW